MDCTQQEAQATYYLPGGEKSLYHQVSPVFTLLASIFTLGLYAYWWHYKNWKCVQRNAEQTISPIMRAFFHPIFAYPIYGMISDTSSNLGLKGGGILKVFGVITFISYPFGTLGLGSEELPYFEFIGIPMFVYVWASLDIFYVQYHVGELNKKLATSTRGECGK